MKAMKILAAATLGLMISACGGGGDQAGDVATLTLYPADVTWTGAADACPVAGGKTVVTIVGGQAPFRITNQFPDFLTVNATEVSGKDPQFEVTTGVSGCPASLTVLIQDYHSQAVTFTVKLEKGSL